MARVDCRVCGREIDAGADSTTSVRGWGCVCADCDDRVEIVTNARGQFVRATVLGPQLQEPQTR